MASANIQKIGSGSLNGGQSTTVGWNNPPAQKVVGFWVAPTPLIGDQLLVGSLSFQVVSVTSTMDKPNHYQVFVNVKNTSNVAGAFDLYMSYVS